MTNSLTELEFKYRVAKDTHILFQEAMLTGIIPQCNEAIYVQSGDDYFKPGKPDDRSFMRLRYFLPSKRVYEITHKIKPIGAINSIKRQEINIRVGRQTSYEEALGFCLAVDYVYTFSINKHVYVFKYNNVDISVYSVERWDEVAYFLEIESLDGNMDTLIEWEKKLHILNISPYKRVKKSLYEIYYGKP